MKYFKYFLTALSLLLFTAACNHDPDEIVISNTNPKIEEHGDVVVNNNTINENFTLVWSPAKFGRTATVSYIVTATCHGVKHEFDATRNSYLTLLNKDLFELFEIDVTGNFDIDFTIRAEIPDGDAKTSQSATVHFFYSKIAYLWVPNSPDFNFTSCAQLLQASDYHFYGFAHVGGEFKFTSQPNWDGTCYGEGAAEGTISEDKEAGNIPAEAGYYYFDVDLEAMTYTAIKITSVSMIGEMSEWKDIAMTYDEAANTWATVAKVAAGQEYKIRFNGVWDIMVGEKKYNISLGGDPENLETAGANLKAVGDGIIGFTLSIANYPYTIKEGEVKDDGTKLYLPTFDGTNWNYASAGYLSAVMEDNKPTGKYVGLADFSAGGDFLFARMPTEFGTRYGNDLNALTEYAGGEQAVALHAAAGHYYLYVDLNAGVMKATPIKINTLSLAGGFNGWNPSDVATAPLTYDAASHTWKLQSLVLAADTQMKIVINGMWSQTVDGVTHELSLGGSALGLALNGADFFMPAGTHSYELSIAKKPYTFATDGEIRDFSSLPDFLELTGKFNTYNWNVSGAPASPKLMPYKGEKGRFAAFMKTYAPDAATADMEFKVTYPNWSVWAGGKLQDGSTYIFDIAVANGDNMHLPFGLNFFDAQYDATAKSGTLTVIPMATVGMVGEIGTTNWGSDVLFASEADGVYTGEIELIGGASFKVRFQTTAGATDWVYNLGTQSKDKLVAGVETELVANASENLVAPAAGTYTVTLNLAKSPNTILIVAK